MRKKKKSADSRAVESMDVDSEKFYGTALVMVDSKEEFAEFFSRLKIPKSSDFRFFTVLENGAQSLATSKEKIRGPRKRRRT